MDKIVSLAAHRRAGRHDQGKKHHGETMSCDHNPASDVSYRDMIELPKFQDFLDSINSGAWHG